MTNAIRKLGTTDDGLEIVALGEKEVAFLNAIYSVFAGDRVTTSHAPARQAQPRRERQAKRAEQPPAPARQAERAKQSPAPAMQAKQADHAPCTTNNGTQRAGILSFMRAAARPVTPNEVLAALKGTPGYPKGKHPFDSVRSALLHDKSVYRRVGRGLFALVDAQCAGDMRANAHNLDRLDLLREADDRARAKLARIDPPDPTED